MGTRSSKTTAARHRILAVITVPAALTALTACGPSPAAPASPAGTPGPASAAPPPSAPPAHATPAPKTATQIATAMGVTGFTAYTADTDPNHLLGRQGEYTSKINWGTSLDNSIEVFATRADAQARLAYGKNFRCPFGDGYDYLDGVALLRLGCSITPAEAKLVEASFRRAIG